MKHNVKGNRTKEKTMNILLVGGACSLMDSMILKLQKEGHKVSILTGNEYGHHKYKKVFEKYEFAYDSENLEEILYSVNADVILLMGAFDTNYRWNQEKREIVYFIAHLVNIIVAYCQMRKGRLIFLSSHEVYSGNYIEDIKEEENYSGSGMRAEALMQAEEICENFRINQKKDIVILRLDHLYQIPKQKNDMSGMCPRLCLECIENGKITVTTNRVFSMLYENDAVEYIYQLIKNKKHGSSIYNLSSQEITGDIDLALRIQKSLTGNDQIEIMQRQEERCVLSGNRFKNEFGMSRMNDLDETIKNITSYIQKNQKTIINGDKRKPSWWQKVKSQWGWLFQIIFPFIENIICFFPFFMLNNRTVGSQYLANLDPFLLYVLLFAIIYGQRQATFSAVLAVAGYMFRQMYTRTGFEVLVDYNTYVWIAQLFILGLIVGYMRDQIRTMRKESEEMERYLTREITYIKDINESNVRVKDVMEQQLIDHKDSIGKIYSITKALDQRMPDEVLFYAVEMLTQLMQTKDVVLYNVANGDYARIFSASSKKARSLGNSIRYKEIPEMYEELAKQRVYINKSLDDRYPLMARAIYDGDEIRMIIMLWGLSWEKMTLGQANFLTVVSYLIQNAALRAQRYINALEDQRYQEGSNILEEKAFNSLVQAYTQAKEKNLAECVLLKICIEKEKYQEVDETMSGKLRDSDYMGMMPDGRLYVLLANATKENAVFVQERFEQNGYQTEVMEKMEQ